MGSIPTTSIELCSDFFSSLASLRMLLRWEGELVGEGGASSGMDADIADLLGISPSQDSPPRFAEIFGEGVEADNGGSSSGTIDLSREAFDLPSKFESDTPESAILDRQYYQKLLSCVPELSGRIHQLLSRFIGEKDPETRSLYREKLVSAYWEFSGEAVKQLPVPADSPVWPLLRYGLLTTHLISPHQAKLLSVIPRVSTTDESIFYVDEWLTNIKAGSITPSSTDEVKTKRSSTGKLDAQLDQHQGRREMTLATIATRVETMSLIEKTLLNKAGLLEDRSQLSGISGIKGGYTESQRRTLSEISGHVTELLKLDREVVQLLNSVERDDREIEKLKSKYSGGTNQAETDPLAVSSEFASLRRMVKLCVGRRGNHFPLLFKQYFCESIQAIATRENIITSLAFVESIDPGVFRRSFKRNSVRIVPYVILVPSFGENGICWEPFDRYNRSSSRGRVVIPMYPKNLIDATVTALADLRWQVAKEKAQHRWMEEGLTGYYYQWFSSSRLKGDIKERFIEDYHLWITKESEGTQKLDKEVRGVFWRHIPFPKEVRQNLRNRGFVYNQLYKKDINRESSDGY